MCREKLSPRSAGSAFLTIGRHLILLSAVAVLSPIQAANPALQQIPLKLDLPPPLFVGTPRPIQLPNLEKPRAGRRPALMVPAGTVNLSKGRPVASSDSQPVTGELSYITDGDKTGVDDTYVEIGPGLQWVQIDLSATASVAAVAVWHFHSQARVYHDVVVQVSDDKEFRKGVSTVFNNDHENVAKFGAGSDPAYIETYEGRLIEVHGAKGRYVRLYSNGNTSDELNHYCEVEVHGSILR